MKTTPIYELIPINGRKSFYGKAKVINVKGMSYLKSYDTIMCGFDAMGNIHRYSNYKSNTTSAHLKSFLGKELYKHFWDLPCEEKPRIEIVL